MTCICGKKMRRAWTFESTDNVAPESKINMWLCQDCGRIYLESPGLEIKGTFYLAEQNEREII